VSLQLPPHSDKPFECTVYGKKFSRSDDLNQHHSSRYEYLNASSCYCESSFQPTEGLHESLMSLKGSSYQGFRRVCLTWLCKVLQRAGVETCWVLVKNMIVLQIYSIQQSMLGQK
jgi:hypothetical protein